MNQNLQGWFTERSPMWPGQAFSLQVKKVLFEKKSDFQDILIFESTHYGKVLVLDGAIQFTERDEFSYQEMLAFLPLNSHPNPKKVLVIGGGDGGIAREVVKHPLVQEIVQCEIDVEVTDSCKTYIPSLGCGLHSPKLSLHIGDGAKFLETTDGKFDIIITDTSDAFVSANDLGTEAKAGPAQTLFSKAYCALLESKLEEGGILSCQCEPVWLQAELIGDVMKEYRTLFPVADYAYTCTPSYPTGQIGFILCSKNASTNFRDPITRWDDKMVDELSLKYYNTNIHQASFILPSFMNKILQRSK